MIRVSFCAAEVYTNKTKSFRDGFNKNEIFETEIKGKHKSVEGTIDFYHFTDAQLTEWKDSTRSVSAKKMKSAIADRIYKKFIESVNLAKKLKSH